MSTQQHREAVDALVEQHARATAQASALGGHLWAAEFLLLRASKYLASMIAPTPALSAARDTICQEIAEFLNEERPHPGRGAVVPEGEAGAAAPTEGAET